MATKITYTPTSPAPRPDVLEDLTPLHACRIAVYDDMAATPQIIEIAPQPIESYMNAITQEVIEVLRTFQSLIPYMVIRECVENLIHASFKNPTISILHKGLLVRFSDQGPGISHKEEALAFGTTTATEEMRKYIRGVGSGLPVAHQYMQDRGGSLSIEDNLDQGCIITVSLKETQDTSSGKTSHTTSVHRERSPLQETPQPLDKKESSLPAVKSFPQKRIQAKNYGEDVETASLAITLSEKEKLAILLCLTREKIGPTDLVQLFGHSLSTWSRTLQYLVGLGLMLKPAHQQKYLLSPRGKEFASHNI